MVPPYRKSGTHPRVGGKRRLESVGEHFSGARGCDRDAGGAGVEKGERQTRLFISWFAHWEPLNEVYGGNSYDGR